MPSMPKSKPFVPRTYLVFNQSMNVWLSREGQWTQDFNAACPFSDQDAAFWTKVPECEFDDLFIMASDVEFEDARDTTIGPSLQDPSWYVPAKARG